LIVVFEELRIRNYREVDVSSLYNVYIITTIMNIMYFILFGVLFNVTNKILKEIQNRDDIPSYSKRYADFKKNQNYEYNGEDQTSIYDYVDINKNQRPDYDDVVFDKSDTPLYENSKNMYDISL
jgi:hypothetical protein